MRQICYFPETTLFDILFLEKSQQIVLALIGAFLSYER